MCFFCRGGKTFRELDGSQPHDYVADTVGVGLVAAPAPDSGPRLPAFYETSDAAVGIGTTYDLGIGQSVHGQISTADSDYYRVELVAGQTYTISLVGIEFTNLARTWLEIRSSSGSVLQAGSNTLPSNNAQITFTATTTGAHYLNIEGFSYFSDTGRYGLSIANGSKGWFDDRMAAGVIDSDYTWSPSGAPVTVTYAFRKSMGDDGEPTFSPVNAAQMAAIEQALQFWSDLCGVTFQRVNDAGSSYSDDATMLFGCYNENDGAGAYAYYPSTFWPVGGDVWLNLGSVSTTASGLAIGSYSYFALIHEIGHTLGLSHPGLYNAGAGQSITYQNNAQFVQDTQQYSVMSYFDESRAGTAEFFGYADAPMLHDVLAIQTLYGANMQARSGNTVYGYNSTAGSALFDFVANTTPAFCLWDAGGRDALDCSGYTGSQTIDLREGCFSSVLGLTRNISIAYGAAIENAIGGSGADYILGNEVANSLSGGAGNDTLEGGAGNDALNGGDGDDLVRGALGRDALYGGNGNDRIGGKEDADWVYGGTGADQLWGDAGDDTLEGGSGSDTLRGGDGVDLLRGDDDNDVLYSDAGDDRAAGKNGNDSVYGGDGNDSLWGDSGDDTVEGGAGNDWVRGGDGSDLIRGGNGQDILYGEAGDDRVAGKEDHDIAYGGLGNDMLWGDVGNDTLWGDYGSDTINGGDGNDVAAIDGNSSAFSIETLPDGRSIVRNLTSGDADILVGVERLSFTDTMVLL